LLSDDRFHSLLAGKLDAGDDIEAIASQGFLPARADTEVFVSAIRRRKKHVGLGPSQHPLRMAGPAGALTVETAKDIIDHAMLSTSSALSFILHAEEALDLDRVDFLHQYATEKNRYEGKTLTWFLRAPLSALGDEAAARLADHRFVIQPTLPDLT